MTVSIGNGVDIGNLVTAETDPVTGVSEFLVGGGYVPNKFRPRRGAARLFNPTTGVYSVMDGTVVAYNGEDAVAGSQNYQCTTANTDSAKASFRYRWASANGPSTDGNGGYVLPVKVLSVGTTPSAEVRLLVSNTVAAGTANATGLQYLQAGLTGWQYLYFPLDKFTANGAPTQYPNAAATYDMQVSFTNKTAGSILDVVAGPIFFSCTMRPAISIGCDDGFLSQYTELFPLMQERGLRGTLSVVPARVGTSGYVTEQMLNEMYAAGWDLVVHGDYTHASFGTREALMADIVANHNYISARWPRAAMHYTYIGGSVNQPWSESVLTELGFQTSRLVTRTYPMGLALENPSECWLRMPSSAILDSTIATRLTDIDDLISGKWVALEMHCHSVNGVSPETPTENTSRANMITLLDKVRDKQALGLLDVHTRSEMYAAYFK